MKPDTKFEKGAARGLPNPSALGDLIETIDILIVNLSQADQEKSYEANSVLLFQAMTFFRPESVVMQQCFPVLDRLERLIKQSDLLAARKQAVLFKTQLQEVQQLIKASGT